MAGLSLMEAPPPSALGLPYERWRPGQFELCMGVLDHPAPFHLVVAPTGFGKSLMYMGMAALSPHPRTVCLTSTKALQDQLNKDFDPGGAGDGTGPLKLYDVRGKGAYPCTLERHLPREAHLVKRGATAANAPCSWGWECPLRDVAGCPYYDRVRYSHLANLLVTNYDWWMYNSHKHGDTGLLVMDEAHQAPQELADYLSFRLKKEGRRYLDGQVPDTTEVDVWLQWAVWVAGKVQARLDKFRQEPPAELRDVVEAVGKMASMLGRGEWVVEHVENGDVLFDCVNPEFWGEALWGGIGKVVMVSATANMMTAKALGVAEDKCKVWDAKSTFPIERRKVWAIEGAVQVNFRMVEGQKRQWVNMIDRLLEQRGDRKGIIHTTSFERARYLQQYSKFSHRLLLNESRTTRDVVRAFKESKQPLVLVSPSVTTGYDFPYEECEFQIIGKIPFPDLRGKAAKVKAERNKEWAGYMAAQVIVQSSGRGMRAEDDQCETIVVDGNFGWWWRQNKRFTPKWWQEAVGWASAGELPAPPSKL